MITQTWTYKLTATFVSLALFLQLFLPAFFLPSLNAQENITPTRPTTPLSSLLAPHSSPLPSLSLSRIQSAYQAGNTVTISYTLTNNQPPVKLPDTSASATFTDTINTLAAFDVTSDPNTLHNLMVETSLTAVSSYLASSLPPTQSGNTLTWQLPDLAPQASYLLTVTLDVPATASDFTDLDSGALGTADLWDTAVSATARPAQLAPSSLSATFLGRTPDADLTDADMLWKTAEFAQDPLTAFTYVQSLGYELYEGSLRGTRGTLWNSAGNSADKSSLLIAMLRAAGIPARYRHGTLDTAEAQTLIATMFPQQQAVAGYLPDGTPTADPLNNSALITLAQDHWWVEAYLPGQGWTNLDASFPEAAVGDMFATPATDGTDRIAELPASTRHTITLRLKIEQYNSFPIGGSNLTTSYPLEVTLNTAELAAKEILLGHFVDTTTEGGMIYTTVNHLYTPYLTIDKTTQFIEGTTYQDLLTNFPLASQFTIALWLELDVQTPDGQVSHYTRTVKDLIGADARIGGGNITLTTPEDNAPFIDNGDLFATWVLPNTVPGWVTTRRRGASLAVLVASAQNTQVINAFPDFEDLTPQEEATLQAAFLNYQIQSSSLLANIGLEFAQQADQSMQERETGLHVKQYFVSPRLFTIGSHVDIETEVTEFNADLRKTDAFSLVYPGQAESAVFAANWIKGFTESSLEGAVLSDIVDQPTITTYRIFDEMAVQGIQPVLLTASDMAYLSTYNLAPAAYAYAAQALTDGKHLLIPSQPVLINGIPTLGWWQIDPATGETIGLTENGLHGAAFEYGFWLKYVWAISTWPRMYALAVKALYEWYLLPNLLPALGGGRVALSSSATITDTWHYQTAPFCPHTVCGIEQFFTQVSHQPIPLPEMLFGYVSPQHSAPLDQSAVFAAANLPPGTPAFTLSLSPASTTMNATETAVFSTLFATNFSDTFTTTVYAPDGWTVTVAPNGQITARPPLGVVPATYNIQVVAQSSQHPALVKSAVHPIAILSTQAMGLAILPEPNLTVPMGQPAAPAASNNTNDGQPEVSGSAFTVVLTNTSTVSHTFEVTINNQPADSLILNGVAGSNTATVVLPAGGVGKIGLYLVQDDLPTAGTPYPFTVDATATDAPSLSETASDTAVIPPLPFAHLTTTPASTLYAAPGSQTTFDLTLSNIGNTAGNFPLTVTLPISTWQITTLQSPISLPPGDSNTQSATLTLPDGPLGVAYPVFLQTTSGDYAQTAVLTVLTVGPYSSPIFQAADAVTDGCTLGSVALPAAIEALAQAVATLEQSCQSGNCSLAARDSAVSAANSLASYANLSSIVTADSQLQTIAASMAAHTTPADLEADMADLGTAVSLLSTELCHIAQHRPSARFVPLLDAALVGQSITYNLEVTNLGNLTTTYAITTQLPSGPAFFNETVLPGQTNVIPLVVSSDTIATYDLTAAVVAQDLALPYISATAAARLNVVDKFVQLTAVSPYPPFVDTGTSSTTLFIDVTNVAGVARESTAHAQILAPGGSVQWTADLPLTILAGLPRTYQLATVNTSGWAEGTYTVTVDLLQDGNLIPDGAGYGYFSVGQSLLISHAVTPDFVSPGTVTVTTAITTEIVNSTQYSVNSEQWTVNSADIHHSSFTIHHSPFTTTTYPLTYISPTLPFTIHNSPFTIHHSQLLTTDNCSLSTVDCSLSTVDCSLSTVNCSLPTSPLAPPPGYTRTEQDNAAIAYTGTWTNLTLNRASGNSYRRADDAGDSATLTVTGSWINIGFIADRNSGHAEIFIDGVSQGILDLYRRDETAVSFIYDNLTNTAHTVLITVEGTANPRASDNNINLDYIDAYDGTPLSDGTFEQTDSRVMLSGGWTTVTNANASGGSYVRGSVATAWFPFSGTSFTFHAMNTEGGQYATLYLDGDYFTTLDMHNFGVITRTFSFDSLANGFHLLQVSSYRGDTLVDAFSTPGTPPFTDPSPPPTTYTRYEEDHPAWLYNGLPFTTTFQSWVRSGLIVADRASEGQYISSSTAGDSAVLTVTGPWISIGFATDTDGGTAEIFIDGLSQGTINLVRNERGVTSRTFAGLTNTAHTITITVLGDGEVAVDYVDVWDGSTLPDGEFDVEDGRFYLSNLWDNRIGIDARGGTYLRVGTGTAWFPFTGDTVSYEAWADGTVSRAKIYIDDQYMGIFDLFGTEITPTFSFDGLGSGAHVLRLESYRGNTSINAFIAPGTPPFYQPPTPTGIIRYEEDHPAMLFNGVPLTQTADTWDRTSDLYDARASQGQYAESQTAGDSVSLAFNGTWVGVGLLTDNNAGQAEIFIDGLSQGIVDLYHRQGSTYSRYFSGLSNGAHTITIVVLGTKHPNSTNELVAIDYFDTWDGSLLPDGTFEETNGRLFLSDNWNGVTQANASGGGYAQDGLSNNVTAWFPFTGDSVTYQAWALTSANVAEIKIDGISQGLFDLMAVTPTTRTFSFDGLGDGPHVLEVRQYRGETTLDAFITPAIGPAYQPPVYTGIVRYEEDHPALLYSGYPYAQTEQTWNIQLEYTTSGIYAARATAVGDTVSLTFNGSWVGVGFHTNNNNAGDAEIFIDGVSQGIFDTSVGEEVNSFYFGDLPLGTHTITVVVVSSSIYFDFFDVWDGTETADSWHNADLQDRFDRVHYGGSWATNNNSYALGGQYVNRSAGGFFNTAWYSFVGETFTFLAFNRADSSAEVFIDGVSQGLFDLTAEFSNQPISLHFPNLPPGPHVATITAVDEARVDGFRADPEALLPYTPVVEWYDTAPADDGPAPYANIGMMSTIALGDLEGDGIVELVAPSSNGTLYVYRGDGQDAGGGSPLLWSTDVVGAAIEPALADLDGDGTAEIIVSGYNGTFVFHYDGSLYWSNPTIQSTTSDGGGTYGWAGPSVANLDSEPGPEIVIAASEDALYVLDHDGTILYQDPIGSRPTVPALADITGDGVLDILVAQGHTLKLYDFASGGNLVWSYTLTQTTIRSGSFGAPAVADVDGNLPGGDDGPEIIINWGHRVEVIDADGSLVWSYYTNNDSHYRPSHIAIADVDGDGEIELITASAVNAGFLVFVHTLMVLNPDGSLLWEQEVADNTASASGIATQDIDGDGIWEILWNGATDGFLIIRGSDGQRLFNEPFTGSGTILDYPTLGDVDGDGYAEVVVGGREGIFVIGYDQVWTNSRPLWNSHDYHITNINDNWSVPANEPPSWTLHNSYRTQTPETNPAPAYGIALTHTVALTGVTVLTNTFSLPVTADPPNYSRAYLQEWYQPAVTLTFQTVLADMQPGEVRQIAQGTAVSYDLLSGQNLLHLPPLYVSAPRIIDITPAEQTAGAGQTAVYTLTLSNFGTTNETFELVVTSLLSPYASYPAQVDVLAGETAEISLSFTLPLAAELGSFPFSVDVTTSGGGQDQTSATLSVVEALALGLEPAIQNSPAGVPASYTLTVNNLTPNDETYILTASGLADVTLPGSVNVAANSSEAVVITAVSSNGGPHPFTIVATASTGAADSVDGVLEVPTSGQLGVAVSLAPETAVGGPGTPLTYTLHITNTGAVSDTYDLSASLPNGWMAQLSVNGQPVDSISLNPFVLHSADLYLLVTPALNATPGNYPVSITAVSQADPAFAATAEATAQVLNRGVQVTIIPGNITLDPTETGSWQVQVHNTGAVADTYDLALYGAIGNSAQFNPPSITVNAGQVATVQLTAENLDFLLPGTYEFAVTAVSQANSAIQNEDIATVTLTGYEAITVAWQPAAQTITNTLTATYLLVISNTGNLPTVYEINISAPGLQALLPASQLTLPAFTTVVLPVAVAAPGNGVYTLTGTAVSAANTTATATATLTVEGAAPTGLTAYLPIVKRP